MMASQPDTSSSVGSSSSKMIEQLGQTVKEQLSSVRKWDGDFVTKEAFSWPQTGAQAKDRMEGNLKFFAANYAVIVCVLMLTVLLLNPFLFLVGALVLGLHIGVQMSKLDTQPVVVGGQKVGKMQAQIIVSVLSVLILLYFAGTLIFALLGVSVFVVGLHAVLHQGSKHKEPDEESPVGDEQA
uniref:PRA1 family protein n=1 Tax=Chromera velia CCMP2878 TaxID=1169474 RepID=A0A0G4F2L5_9ALVE|mmetsp:Transcript_49414/g.97350  ORF Transcript_49414/g.97350 Transcript_49414/m.97350 type:complete len:183 (+) Transcript_49414:207-755(+)|eukprot:Cvel_2646.t1-p1 / transcript=Cvel_2646.t1 / gene=Cvel_2646 / organism=Chromera_velia_CCMP2878 / gene_product=hypothetical protein / transcript_product=hypothetical protein / location=Cvel_scaffold105:42683-43894(+) / protein_length=182 / sequence_SO=supercontig / SO=protein_coding / is_pseudo=false